MGDKESMPDEQEIDTWILKFSKLQAVLRALEHDLEIATVPARNVNELFKNYSNAVRRNDVEDVRTWAASMVENQALLITEELKHHALQLRAVQTFQREMCLPMFDDSFTGPKLSSALEEVK